MNRKWSMLLTIIAAVSLTFAACKKDKGGESCSDGILNQNEEEVDCGGPCSPCATPAMSALIDGTNWSAVDTFYLNKTSSAGFTSYQLKGLSGSKAVEFFFIFTDGVDSLKENVVYKDSPTTSGFTFVNVRMIDGSTIYNNLVGTVELTFTRIAYGRATGTFKFTGSGGGATHSITNGTFTRIKING
ncbi:MAG TPA: hypothetical protein PKN14_10590 [Bacteroidia bacterium]|nr:hypothetical protein [Bacteroidia bacterium]MBV6454841.1 hypothetical protein [Bacteroidia bacterium]HNR49682.1 hypothetical protein [Bacteroidia bacterium]HNT81817.1 hypothetical protein [Bacteroidia bacterium]